MGIDLSGRTTGGVKDEIGAILAFQLRRPIDQPANFRLDSDVERFALDRFSGRLGHDILLK